MADSNMFPELKRPIEDSCLFTNAQNPFSELEIADTKFLDNVSDRGICSKCGKSRRYFCYNCYVAVLEIEYKIPKVKLPVKIDIIKHPKEVDGKSTSAHAAVLASDDVRVFTYPDFPSYENEKVLLMFPGKSAVELRSLILSENVANLDNEKEKMNPHRSLENHTCLCFDSSTNAEIEDVDVKKQSSQFSFPFDRVIFIDSTWKQTKRLYRDPVIHSLPCAVLTSHKSVFWRHQRGKPDCYLSTIEAIYYFFVELHELQYPGVPYCRRYDNLLFFFKFMYFKIRTLYDPAKLKAYRQSLGPAATESL